SEESTTLENVEEEKDETPEESEEIEGELDDEDEETEEGGIASENVEDIFTN
ncbi:hypothetical protein H8D91_02185, partial [archaeon]|nr:hypothetical protein [archaeon]